MYTSLKLIISFLIKVMKSFSFNRLLLNLHIPGPLLSSESFRRQLIGE